VGQGLVLTPRGSVAMVEGDDAIRQAILLLLSTVPGERVKRPGYGCHIHRLIFSPNDDTTAGLAIHYVRRALDRWEPRVEIVSLDARRNDLEPERLDVLLEYRVRATQRVDTLIVSVDLTGGAA
jgi:phage baseplate assembly protein W